MIGWSENLSKNIDSHSLRLFGGISKSNISQINPTVVRLAGTDIWCQAVIKGINVSWKQFIGWLLIRVFLCCRCDMLNQSKMNLLYSQLFLYLSPPLSLSLILSLSASLWHYFVLQICTWNIRNLYSGGASEILSEELDRSLLDGSSFAGS